MRLDRKLAILALALGATTTGFASTRPRIIHETQKITVPDLRDPDTLPDDGGPNSQTYPVAVDGSEMIVVGHHTLEDAYGDRLAAYLYTRSSGGAWTLAR